MNNILAVLMCLGLLPIAAAAGEVVRNGKKIYAACEADIKVLCAGVPQGDGRLIACIKAHDKELSEKCHAKVDPKVEAKNAACDSDKKRLCPGVDPDNGGIAACLAAHVADVSAACRSRMAEKEAALKAHGPKKAAGKPLVPKEAEGKP
jgi:hypothetical protein